MRIHYIKRMNQFGFWEAVIGAVAGAVPSVLDAFGVGTGAQQAKAAEYNAQSAAYAAEAQKAAAQAQAASSAQTASAIKTAAKYGAIGLGAIGLTIVLS